MTNFARRRATARARFTVATVLLATTLACLADQSAWAHGGHDHGADSAALEIKSLNRAVATSEAYQVVAVLDRDKLIVTLDHLGTNEPISDAEITVMIGSATKTATVRPDKSYIVAAPELVTGGRHELVITIKEGTGKDARSDLLITAIDSPEKQPASAAGKARIVADTPSRLSDGSAFVPKITQRLIGLRTVVAAQATIEPALALVGRVIPDPNRSGVVQSTIAGRLAPAEGRLPRLGESVKRGQLLATVTSAFAAIDLTNVQQTAGELDQQIALAQNKVEQFRPLVRNNTFPPERLRVVEIELENLRKRRATLTSSQRGGEPLLASADGVIAATRAVPGQVVAPQDILFQIVDPKSLWVEALVFDPSMPDLLADATLTLPDHAPLKLQLIGRSRSLQQLSTIVHFAVTDPPSTLNIGSPVTVLARTAERVTGTLVPRAAVVTAASGSSAVWVQTDPERFQQRAVKVRPVDGERVVVEAGLEAGERVVATSAELINQVR